MTRESYLLVLIAILGKAGSITLSLYFVLLSALQVQKPLKVVQF